MTANELRTKYLKFFESKGHTIVPSASLVPRETDASTLFTTAGMHPLVPYLLGEKHPGGTRVTNVQKCVRTGDIDDVGDNRHLTFFEMLGNWSFGDYFKKEAIEWSYEFLTDPKVGLGLDPKRLYISVFKGEGEIPRDEESISAWRDTFKKAGMEVSVAGDDEIINGDVRIIPLGVEDNFWIAGTSGPCGGDTEMFYDTRPEEGKLEGKFGDLVDSGRIIEIWNNVFMEFNKTPEGKYEKLEKPNVDTGMGVERTIAILNGKANVFETELFQPLFDKISKLSSKTYNLPASTRGEDRSSTRGGEPKTYRIIADHIRSSVFLIADGVTPSNTGRGYVLRRLIRRAVRYGKMIGIKNDFSAEIAKVVIEMMGDFYPELEKNHDNIFFELKKEEQKFSKTLEKGTREFDKKILLTKKLDATETFDLYQSYGFPLELIEEMAKEKGVEVDSKGFWDELKKHQELSRTASAGMFKGGLQDSGEETAKLHTATHLLLAALRHVLGEHVYQKGSNITAERLRFDFSHPEKMTPEQIEKVEALVNDAIQAHLEVIREEMTLQEARDRGVMGVFGDKYGENVTVYSAINSDAQIFSQEMCGGPHVKNTGELGKFKITKEEASSAGVRRIKAVLQ